jgi:tetraacyldisaccharide 4'-kinase
MFWGLYPFSFLYGLTVRLRSCLYRSGLKKSYRASVPVVSVGNITVGGTGKTPMVDFLVKHLISRGIRCAVVSRGYGGNYRQAVGRVSDASGNLHMAPEECGDEPCLLAKRNPGVPVYVARQRVLGVKTAERDGAQLVVLDDGFQHLAVQRNVNIVLLDAKLPFGNGFLLPAGMLREPRPALKRADLIVMTRSDNRQRSPLPVGAPVMQCRHQLNESLTNLSGQRVPERNYVGKSCLAFAGIARTDEFFSALRCFGFRRIEEVPLADHQQYNGEILNRLLGSCHNYDLLVTTEKDAVKLSSVNFPKPCYQVGVDLVFDDISPLDSLLDVIMESCK